MPTVRFTWTLRSDQAGERRTAAVAMKASSSAQTITGPVGRSNAAEANRPKTYPDTAQS